MELLLIYYNPNSNCFYIKAIHTLIFDKFIGYTNDYNHTICQIFLIRNNSLIPITSFWEYLEKNKNTSSKKNKIIDRIIGLLNKLKD